MEEGIASQIPETTIANLLSSFKFDANAAFLFQQAKLKMHGPIPEIPPGSDLHKDFQKGLDAIDQALQHQRGPVPQGPSGISSNSSALDSKKLDTEIELFNIEKNKYLKMLGGSADPSSDLRTFMKNYNSAAGREVISLDAYIKGNRQDVTIDRIRPLAAVLCAIHACKAQCGSIPTVLMNVIRSKHSLDGGVDELNAVVQSMTAQMLKDQEKHQYFDEGTRNNCEDGAEDLLSQKIGEKMSSVFPTDSRSIDIATAAAVFLTQQSPCRSKSLSDFL